MSYEVGSLVRTSVTVTDVNGAAADATMAVAVTRPDGTAFTPTPSIVHDGTGLYHADVQVDQPGVWPVVWSAGGAVISVYSNQLTVRSPGPAIMSLAEAKAHLNKDPSVTTDDDELRGFIDAAQVVIENVVGPIVPKVYTERYDGWVQYLVLRHRPVISITSAVEIYAGVSQAVVPEAGGGTGFDYLLRADRGVLYRRSGLFPYIWQGEVVVTYTAGKTPIPANVSLAAKEELAHLWRNSQLARGGARAAAGSDDVLSSLAYSVPRRVLDLLANAKKAPQQGAW